ncbi:hypothetical protein [Streptomyces sp. 1331.2]|uniref:hypothetical protein n=1 Tax=Streptomyces sp. 1331.2 TaxID=1938835 RepID=UPI000BCECE60|nr:hypothetical protein [Streptomyces sp. 1331.2]SOB79695.1 hypothetical protein SAMN06272789_0565 [Streptomyces sp. 1331.2]
MSGGGVLSKEPVSALLNAELARPDSPLRSIDPRRHPVLADLKRARYLSRPLVYPESEMRAFGADLLGSVELLTSLPARLFDGDVERTCRALGLDPRKAELVGDFQKQSPPRFGRIDAYHDGEALRVLEFNVGGSVGGQEWVQPLAEMFWADDAFRAFGTAHGLHHLSQTTLLAEALREAAAPVCSGRDPVIAMVEGTGGLDLYAEGSWYLLRRLLEAEGLDCRIGEVQELEVTASEVRFQGRRVDLVYRLFDLDQVVDDPDAWRTTVRLRDAHRSGQVALWAPLECDLTDNKRFLAYLSDPQLRGHMSQQERDMVDRVLPWTRALVPGAAGLDTVVADCRERREHLILKPDGGFAGKGITCGWLVSDEQWAEALQKGADEGAVAQQRVVPREEPVVNAETGLTESWDACLGLYWVPGDPGGLGGLGGGGGRLVHSGEPADSTDRRLAPIYLYPDQDPDTPHGAELH